MNDPETVLVACASPRPVAELREALPGWRVLSADASGSIPMDGQVWCFVDWLLPDSSGLEMCRLLRRAPHAGSLHITIVLEDEDDDMRRRALRAGADDYAPGPMSAGLVLGRLRKYRAAAGQEPRAGELSQGDLVIDREAFQVRWRKRPVPLRHTEFRLLACFVRNAGRVMSRGSLIAAMNGSGETIDERTVDVYVGRLRRALREHGIPDPLRTVRSVGYVFDPISGD